MSLEDLLNGWMSERRDVTFPVHPDDTPSHFTPFGFDDAGRGFSPNWELQFAVDARLTAAFTGLVFVYHDVSTAEYFIDILIAAAPPIRPIAWFPSWYPMPDYARYGPFNAAQVRDMATNLLTEDEAVLGRLISIDGSVTDDVRARRERNQRRLAPVRNALSLDKPAESDSISNIVDLLIARRLTSGLPVAAGEVMVRLPAGEDVRFWLHPSTSGTDDSGTIEIDSNLYMDPAFYFSSWSRIIEDYDRFPIECRRRSIGPPLTSGRVHFVREMPDPAVTATQHPTIQDALHAALEHDVILILDKAHYAVAARVTKYVSILGLVARDDDPRDLKNEPEAGLTTALSHRYPTIRAASGWRGLRIRYEQGALRRTMRGALSGIIYLAGLSISGNHLDADSEQHRTALGGAGVLIEGEYYDPGTGDDVGPLLGSGFSAVHLHHCAITSNRISASTNIDLPMQGGGVMCNQASPVISECLLSFNHSIFQGGGIGIHRYSFPRILDNVISRNVAHGWESGHHGGDGGGIGILQAPPNETRARALASRLEDMWDTTILVHAGDIPGWVRDTYDTPDLDAARRYRIAIVRNEIRNNTAYLSGGGVYATVCAFVRLHENQIIDNTASGERGGGIGVTFGSDVIVYGGTIRANNALEFGGGIYVRSSRLELTTCSITDNASSSNGGGVTVEMRPEMLIRGKPGYDLVLHSVFTHISRTELVLREVTVSGNTGGAFPSVHGRKDEHAYTISPWDDGVTVGLIGPMPLRIDVDRASSIAPPGSTERIDETGARTNHPIVPGTPLEL